MEEPGRKRHLGRPTCRWVYNIKMDLGERIWGSEVWIGLAHEKDKWEALMNGVMMLRVP